jgi:hypothetical protein
MDRMHHRMNMIPILETLGAIPDIQGEQQEVEVNLDLSVHAENDPDDDAAGVVEDVLGQEIEDTAPPILSSTPPSNSGGSRKQGVATTARATTSSSKKKKVAVQCCKGACVKVAWSNLFHVLEHDEQREALEGYGNSGN